MRLIAKGKFVRILSNEERNEIEMERLFIYLIIVISLLYTVRKQYILVFIFSFFGSVSDSASLSHILNELFPPFSYVMFTLVSVASIICLTKRTAEIKKAIPEKYVSGIYFFLIAFLFLFFLQEISISLDIKILARFVDFYVNYGIASFVILLCWLDRIDIKKYIYWLVLTHCVLAFLTLYGNFIGMNFFSLLNNNLYLEPEDFEKFRHNFADPFLIRRDFWSIIQNKQSIYISSFFGNPNILGFYSGTLCLLSILNLYEKRYKYLSIISFILGSILWLDAGTRAPLLALVVVVIYVLYNKGKKLLPALILIAAVCFPVLLNLYNTQVSEGVTSSVSSREERLNSEWLFFLNHLIIGSNSKDYLEASPHQLWLLYGTRIGFVGLFFSIIYYYLFPILDLLKKHSLYTVGIFSLLLFSSNTNNFMAIVLYMTAFASLVGNTYIKKYTI